VTANHFMTGESSTRDQPRYQVRLDVFEGPLDLLLRLIERQELDITKVSLVAVTDQYLDYIRHLQRLDVATLADFLVVAAKLLLIKSRALLPTASAPDEPEQEDVGDALVRQLREYKVFKELALQLREREEAGLRAYLRVAPPPRLEKKLDLTGVTLEGLLAAVQAVLVAQPALAAVNGLIPAFSITIGEKIQAIDALVARKGSFGLLRLLRRAQSRAEIVVTLLALLEMIKLGRVSVQQEKLFGEIVVTRAEPAGLPASQQPPQQ
jgi:segregation and condensation protein A